MNPNTLLWLNGFAGCGKSVLCSTAIEHVFRHRQATSHSKIGIAMFFFAFSDDARQDASAMLRSLLSQLSLQLGDKHSLVSQFCDNYQSTTPPNHVLVEILRQLVSLQRRRLHYP
jgi:ankyrin repeat domain-containing protein 50